MEYNIKNSWLFIINKLIKKYFNENQLLEIYSKNIIYPKFENIFEAFKYFEIYELKLVLLGQDPYISQEMNNGKCIIQATGLSFSVPKEIKKIPPSLLNIFKELKNEFNYFNIPNNGDLIRWVKEEKILLLNTSLTVEKGKSNSHQHLWINFINELIEYISQNTNNVIFLFLGNNAKSKKKYVDQTKHFIFEYYYTSFIRLVLTKSKF